MKLVRASIILLYFLLAHLIVTYAKLVIIIIF